MESTGVHAALDCRQPDHGQAVQATPLVVFVQRGDDRARHFLNLDKVVRAVQKQLKLRTRWGSKLLAAPGDSVATARLKSVNMQGHQAQ